MTIKKLMLERVGHYTSMLKIRGCKIMEARLDELLTVLNFQKTERTAKKVSRKLADEEKKDKQVSKYIASITVHG
jgi:hypothetical protein